MVFLGLEKPVEYGSRLIFDPTMAKMVLDALNNYILAMREDYLRGREDLKEFNKNFGDFFSPILKDMEWYDLNVTGATRDLINNMYAQGIDPLRSVEGRALISRWINNMPTGKINLLKLSADIAKEYLRAELDLRRRGLYDPRLVKYEGPSLSEYSTLGDDNTEAMGVWGRTSPTPIHDLATFGNPYFEGMKPNVHKRSKNGITYSEESITMDDLKAIADSKYNELINTPLGQLMHKYYRDLAGSEEGARDMFNQAIANAQQRRTYVKDDYEDNYFKRQQLALQALSNQLARDKFNWEKQKHQQEHPELYGGDGSGAGNLITKDGFSWAEREYNKMLSNIISDGITNTAWYEMPRNYGTASSDARNIHAQFGRQFRGNLDYASIKNAYISRWSTPIDEATVVTWMRRGTVDGNNGVSKISAADINKFLTEDAVVTNTAGYTKKYRGGEKDENLVFTGGVNEAGINNIKDAINKYGASNTTVTPLGTAYGSIRKNSGAAELYPRVKVVVDCGGGRTIETECYFDMGLHSASTPDGAYVGNQHVTDVGGGVVNIDAGQGNYYPNYNDWLRYGPRDLITNKSLTATASLSNAGF